MAIRDNFLTKTALYEGNGSTDTFAITFDFRLDSEVVPYLYNKDTNALTRMDNALYVVDMDNSSLIYPDPSLREDPHSNVPLLQEGQYLIIIRQTELSQLEESANKSFTSQDIERALDKLTRITQELAECCDRSIKFNPAQVVSPDDLDAQRYIDILKELLASTKAAEQRALKAVEDAERKIEEANTTLETAQKEVEVAKQSAAEAVSEAKKAVDANAEAQKALTETKVLAGDVKTGLASKQDKLTPGNNITIEGRVISAVIPETVFGIDNATIKRNASNTISTVAVKDEHKGTIMGFWQGTLAEYNTIKNSLPATTIALITDDAEVHLNLTEHDFVTTSVFNSSLANKQDVGDYATNDDLNAGLGSKQPIGDYVTANELPDLVQAQIPTGVSAFVNDAGYLTESPDVSIYATKASVPVTVEEVLATKNYASKSEIPTVPTKVSELDNDEGFVTNDEVNVDAQLTALREELQPQIDENSELILTKQDTLTAGTGLVISTSGDNTYISTQIASETTFGTIKLIYTAATGTLNILTR